MPGMKLFASIYIGSYEVILKIFQVSKGKNMKEIDCLKAQTGIARDIYGAKMIAFETVERICSVLSDMQKAMETYQVTEYRAYMGSTIHLAKNEIYARHGYIFKNQELNAYFLSQIWYLPEFDSGNFDSSVLNEYENANLQLLVQLDTYK